MAANRFLTRGFGAALALGVASPAFAHHPMGGVTPTTFMQGLLSGFGHPIIGLDHFAAIIGVGILAALIGARPQMVFAFVAAMIGGVVLHLASFDLPNSELLVALSTLFIGQLVALRLAPTAFPLTLVFATAGLVHGYALGESIVGAEPTPLYAYFAGLAIVQSAIALGAYAAIGVLRSRTADAAPVAITAAGLAIAVLGGYFAGGAAGLWV
ncbi:MAG: HupE/UreJ family protein [Hyphomicrobium sp.]